MLRLLYLGVELHLDKLSQQTLIRNTIQRLCENARVCINQKEFVFENILRNVDLNLSSKIEFLDTMKTTNELDLLRNFTKFLSNYQPNFIATEHKFHESFLIEIFLNKINHQIDVFSLDSEQISIFNQEYLYVSLISVNELETIG